MVHEKITAWLKNYVNDAGSGGFVVGVSGGIDSALTSTLCALTGHRVIAVGMPIQQEEGQLSRSQQHMDWLCENFSNVEQATVNLTPTFHAIKSAFVGVDPEISNLSQLALANTQSRLRMATLYAIANSQGLLVAGTGNKVEDYGIGFFTKYGDGGVDISPIADLLKTEVRSMSRELGIPEEVVNAVSTDGLWADNRSDEQQIGATYEELEWALEFYDSGMPKDSLSERQVEVLTIYTERHEQSRHKLELPPVCDLSDTEEI